MQYVGVDIIEIERIVEATARWGERFLNRVFTPAEIKNYKDKPPSLAARFAAKEAVMKAISACDSGTAWREIEVLADEEGKPVVKLCGQAKLAAQKLSIKELSVSLSHSKEYAVAFVVGGA